MTAPRLFVEFTTTLNHGAIVKHDPPILLPVTEVHEYDQSGPNALVSGRGLCPLWFSLDRLRVIPGEGA